MKDFLRFVIFLIIYYISINSSSGQSHCEVLDLQTMQYVSENEYVSPSITMNADDTGLTIKCSYRYVILECNEDGTKRIVIDAFPNNFAGGEYEIPIRNLNVSLNGNEIYRVQTKNVSYVDIPGKLSCAPEELIEGEDDGNIPQYNCEKLFPLSASSLFYPAEIVFSTPIQYYRGSAFLPVTISPVQYDENNNVIRINNYFEIQISNDSAVSLQTNLKNKDKLLLSIAENDKFLDEFILSNENKQEKLTASDSGDILAHVPILSYLILTTNKYGAAANKLANWKRLLGYDVTIKFKSGTDKSFWDVSQIKDAISEFASENRNFYYLTIIGNEEAVPGVIIDHVNKKYGQFTSDFPYACLDGDGDVTPDIYYGRIPANTRDEANNAVDKIINYDFNPCMDRDFYKTSFHAGEFHDVINKNGIHTGEEDGMFIYTLEEVKKAIETNYNFDVKRIYAADECIFPYQYSTVYVSNPPKYLTTDMWRHNFEWDRSCKDIINAINSGSLYGLYRGHGSFTGWEYNISFTSDKSIGLLNNSNRYPLIFSITCQTGAYNKSEYCLAKEFITSPNAGAIGVFAFSEASYTPINDVLTGSIFNGIWPQNRLSIFPRSGKYYQIENATTIFDKEYGSPKLQLGKIMNFSSQVLSAYYPSTHKKSLLTKQMLHCFGDPSLTLRTKVPINIWGLKVVKDDNGFIIAGHPKSSNDGALIAVVDTMVKKLVYFDVLRDGRIDYNFTDRCKICISGQNIKPIVFNGKDGYDGRIPIMGISRSNDNEWYANFITGEKEKSVPTGDYGYKYLEYPDGRVEINVNGAVVKNIDVNNDSELWSIVGGSMNADEFGDPLVPMITLLLEKSDDESFNNFELIEAQYVDFPDSKCITEFYLEDDCGEIVYDPLIPYSGIKPARLFDVYESKLNKNFLCLEIYPVKYDYEHKIMRAYNKIRLMRGQDSGISEIISNQTMDEFYTIDGFLSVKPIKGQFYIRKRGNEYKKILY